MKITTRTLLFLWWLALLSYTLMGCERLAPVDPNATPTATPDPRELPTLPPPTSTATHTPEPTLPPLETLPPTLTPSPTPVPQILAYQNEAVPFTFQYPSNWFVNDEDPAAVMLASDERTLTFNVFEGGIIFFFPREAAAPERLDPAAILAAFIEDFAVFDSEELVGGIEPADIGGQPAATARAEAVFNRFPVVVEYTSIVQEPRFLVTVTMIAEEAAPRLNPVAGRIVRSIRFSGP